MSITELPRGTRTPRDTGLVHEALFYRDASGYVDGILRFLRAGFARAEPALVAVPRPQLQALRAALGQDARRVEFVNIAHAGRNPGRIIPNVLFSFVQQHPTGRVRIVTEPIWSGRSAAEYRTALQHEALVNIALADQQTTILCAYDQTSLDETALADACRTHTVLTDGDQRRASATYTDPRVVADGCLTRLPDPPAWWGEMLVFGSASDLRAVRQFVENLAVRAGLSPKRVSDLCLAVNEVATNTLLHTDNPGILSVWEDSGTGSLVCEISDSGQLSDRLVGRIPPAQSDPHGRGLILVNTLCDLVELPTGQVGSGTTLRLHMARQP